MTKDEIKQLAQQLGFDGVGVSRPSPQTFQHYQDWLSQGYHGEMAYLERRSQERGSPDLLLNQVSSIIVVAKRYLTVTPKKPTNDNPFAAQISRYAWGDDYHEVMKPSLKTICDEINTRSNGKHHARWCVDTAPVLEKDFAAQAGIGWFGKHTNLLSKSLGNWFFLGAILTTLDLEPDEPVTPHCGTCTRCLDICPTNAFIGPYQMDARRCISYLTIELKGPIPSELRPLMGQHVYGCDDCLEVCPWNRHAQPTDENHFIPRHNLDIANLIDLIQMDDDTFRKRFKGSPIKRTKRRGLLRNVTVALGNTKNPVAVTYLIKALHDHEPLIRSHAAWALGQIGGDKSTNALKERLQIEMDEWVREEIQYALKQLTRL